MTEDMQREMARQLIWAFALFVLFIVFLFVWDAYRARGCSSDGYLMSYGEPVYRDGKPVKCVRMPL